MNDTDAASDDPILDPEIRRFVEYWNEKRGGAKYPARADLISVQRDMKRVEERRARLAAASEL